MPSAEQVVTALLEKLAAPQYVLMRSDERREPAYYRDGGLARPGRSYVHLRATDPDTLRVQARVVLEFSPHGFLYRLEGEPSDTYVNYGDAARKDAFFAAWNAALQPKAVVS